LGTVAVPAHEKDDISREKATLGTHFSTVGMRREFQNDRMLDSHRWSSTLLHFPVAFDHPSASVRLCLFSLSDLRLPDRSTVQRLQAELTRLTDGFDGRVGVCALDAPGQSALGRSAFLHVERHEADRGMAVMDAVDHGQLHLQDAIAVRREDLSLFVQPITALVGRWQIAAAVVAHYQLSRLSGPAHERIAPG
jgi:hypothetical protein